MPKKTKNKSISDDFFWEIPGDVPGKRAQDDPFQSARSAPNLYYQVAPQQVSRESTVKERTDDFSSHRTESGSNDSARSLFISSSRSSTRDTSTSDVSNNKSFRWLPILLALLFVMGLAGMSYQYFINSPDKLLAQNTADSTQNATSAVVTIKQPKIFELFLGMQDKTAQSKLRIITHVVVKGDTLWDIAETYVKDPFRYPELAELSKIKNPDLIYPYELVRIHIYE